MRDDTAFRGNRSKRKEANNQLNHAIRNVDVQSVMDDDQFEKRFPESLNNAPQEIIEEGIPLVYEMEFYKIKQDIFKRYANQVKILSMSREELYKRIDDVLMDPFRTFVLDRIRVRQVAPEEPNP